MATRGACLTLALWALTATATADPATVEETYESERVAHVMGDLGLRRHGSPEGRRIEYVRLVVAEVFADDEFWPDLPATFRGWRFRARRHPVTVINHLHALTDEDVIERELLLREGDVYTEARAQESMRNLRGLGIFSLVRIVAVSVPGKDTVGLLVHTRDIWSLRLETDFQGTAGTLQLRAQLVERNLFGRNKRATLRTELRTDTLSVGEVYFDHRLLGASLQLSESFDVIVNRETSEVEGGVGSVYLGKPFYTIAQRWAFEASARHLRHIVRRHDGQGEVLTTDLAADDTDDTIGCDPAQLDCVRLVYAQRSTTATASAHHRRGRSWLHTFTAGAGFTDRDAEPNAETSLDVAERDDFRDAVLPAVRRQVYPFVRHRLSMPVYGQFQNLATFGVTESLRLGPSTDVAIGLPLSAIGSTRDAVFASAGIGYRHKLGRAMLDLAGSASGRIEGDALIDELAVGRVRGATPPWLLGRLVLSARWEVRRDDTARTLVFLDGSNGLRGYPIGTFIAGGSRVMGTLEYRTLPLRLQSTQVGGILFCDAGSLYRSLSDIAPRASIGAGVRLLLPQLNRYAFRLDAGLPVDGSGFGVMMSFGRGQAVALTPQEDLVQSSDIRAR